MPFFHPKGACVYNGLIDYVRELYARYGFGEVVTPQILDVELWKTSGHYDNYRENMFFTEVDEQQFAVEADELPDPLPDLRDAQALLPRPADPLRRLRAAAPLRAQRRDHRPVPGALVLARTTPTSSAPRSRSSAEVLRPRPR